MFKRIQLSFFFTKQTSNAPRSNADINQDISLELIWNRLIDVYFPQNQDLKSYSVLWSNRIQTRCLASCNVEKRIVRVARSMKLAEARMLIEPLLYHELCHAVVGIKIVKGRRKIHTKEFKILEKRHPMIPMLDLWIRNGGWSKVVIKDMKDRKLYFNSCLS